MRTLSRLILTTAFVTAAALPALAQPKVVPHAHSRHAAVHKVATTPAPAAAPAPALQTLGAAPATDAKRIPERTVAGSAATVPASKPNAATPAAPASGMTAPSTTKVN